MKTLKVKIAGHELEVPFMERLRKDWVGVRSICEALEINWPSQRRKLTQTSEVEISDIYISYLGGRRKLFSINIDHITAWLDSIMVNKIDADKRDRLFVFKRQLQKDLLVASREQKAVQHSDFRNEGDNL